MTVRKKGPIDLDALTRQLGDGHLACMGDPASDEKVELSSDTHSDDEIRAALQRL